MSLHLGCRLMRQSSYSPRCKKLVALGSFRSIAAWVTKVWYAVMNRPFD